jgi:hypothetical protein
MKQLLFSVALGLSILSVKAQSLSPQVIASSGAFSVAGGYSLSYTVGEMSAIQTYSAGGAILTQGFQQPNDIVSGLLDIQKDINGTFVLYPNPAIEQLWFGYEFDGQGSVEVSLYDVTGRQLDYSLIENYNSGKVTHSLNSSAYAAGQYMLSAKFTSESGQTKIITQKFQILN